MDIREQDLRTKTSDELQIVIAGLTLKMKRPYRSTEQKTSLQKRIDKMEDLKVTAKIRELMSKANHPSRTPDQRIELREEIQRLQNERDKN